MRTHEDGGVMVYLMANGEAMRGGRLHFNIAAHPFIAESQTAAKYRLFSIRDEFPGILHVGPEDGASIRGELYDVPLEVLRDRFLPDEPPELELEVIELVDGTATLSMVLRATERDRHADITAHGGWRAYGESLK